MKTKFFAALLIACAGLCGGLFSTVGPTASASCAPGFTSIPCTIANNVSQAPATLAGQGCAQPTNGNASGNASNCGLPSITNLAGVGCPPASDGSSTEPCGLVAVPTQLAVGVLGLPGQFATGAGVIAGAPSSIAGNVAAAPGQLAGGLAAAPGQFIRAIQNGGTDPESQ